MASQQGLFPTGKAIRSASSLTEKAAKRFAGAVAGIIAAVWYLSVVFRPCVNQARPHAWNC